MKKMDKVKIFKITLTILVLTILIGMIIYIFPVIKQISTPEGQLAFKQKIDNSGFLGILTLFAMQFSQIFLFILPGEPIEVLAGMCYGAFGGTIFLLISSFIISLFIFMLVSKFGTQFVYSFCDENQVNKIQNSKLFKNSKKVEYTLFLLFLIPGTPKDLLVFISGLLPIEKPYRFITISTLARFPSIITSTLAGNSLSAGNWKFSIMIYVVMVIIILIVVFFLNKLDKGKVTKDVIDIMK